MIGSFITQVRQAHLLLVLLLSVYVNLVKELFLHALFQAVSATVFPKASAKVLLFSELAKFFTDYFRKKFYFREFDNKNRRTDPLFGKSERNMSSNTILPIKYIKALTHASSSQTPWHSRKANHTIPRQNDG